MLWWVSVVQYVVFGGTPATIIFSPCIHWRVSFSKMLELRIQLLLLFTVSAPVYVQTQTDDDFNCTFSGQVGENVVCYCSVSVPNYMILWWDENATFPCITMLNTSRPRLVGSRLRAEVVNGSTHPTGAFTSKLTLNVSIELNGTEIGCSRSPSNSCSPSDTDPDSFRFLLLVKNCTDMSAPNPPRNFSLAMEPNPSCNSSVRNINLSWEEPEPRPCLPPVTHYNFSYTTDDGDSCSEQLPANMQSFNFPAVAGVRYTITVSALIGESQSLTNQQLNFATVKVVNETSSENNATLLLRVGDFTSNITINYGPCSPTSAENYTTMLYMTSTADLEIQLVNLNAETMYCYSITLESHMLVTSSCDGELTTTAKGTSPPTTPPDINIGLILGIIVGVCVLLLIVCLILCGLYCCCKNRIQRWWENR